MEKIDTKKKALKWLYQDELQNILSIDLLEQDVAEILHAGTNSLLLASDGMLLTHCPDPGEWDSLYRVLKDEIAKLVYWVVKAHDEWYVQELIALLTIEESHVYYNAIFPDDVPVPENSVEGLEIRPLTMNEFAQVRSLYKTVDDDEYITERIHSGTMLGAWLEGVLTGFIGTHGDGTMGLMEVDPAYRRRGIGRALEGALIGLLRSKQRRTFGNIAADNPTAREVHQKVGAIVAPHPVYWLFTEND